VAIVVDDVTETKRLRAIQDMFRRYLSPAVVDRLPSDPAQLRLGGHRQEVSILFADIRGFTSFSEKLPPEEVMDTLNRYLSMAAEAILAYEGTLDKFMGDAVMAIFNAPLPQEDHVLRAVKAAVAMQQAIADYHRQLGEKRGLSFGVGINVGQVVVGNIGTTARMDYTAIGDAVNLAKRLQENVGGGRILLSQSTHERVKDYVRVKVLPPVKVRGRVEPEPVYELIRLIR
jgi:class 3 adenylate cyclase